MMKFKHTKKVLCFGIALSMLTSLCACGSKEKTVEKMEAEEVHSVSFDFLGGDEVMPISGYYGPLTTEYSFDGQSLPNYFTDEMFESIAECGLNLIHHSYTDYSTSPELAINMLKQGEKYNLGICVNDAWINQPAEGVASDINALDERISNYCDYPAFCGVYVVDEPGNDSFHPMPGRNISRYGSVFQNLTKLNVFGSGNLFPVWQEEDREVYKKYIEEYYNTCNPMYLSYDYYVWDEGRDKAGYFYNADIIRHYAEEYNIPFWVYIQAGGQWNDSSTRFDSTELYPTEGQLQWNVNTSLAYGAKGIQYFPLIQPHYFAYAESTDYDFQRNGLLGAWGNKTQWWYYAQNMNKQIAAVDSVLMKSVNKGVIVTGEEAESDTKDLEFVMKNKSWRELESVEGNTMIGCFNYQGKTALYVVNYEEAHKQKVTLNLLDTYNLSVTQNAEVSKIQTDTLTLDMEAGEGVLVVFEE